MSNIHYEKIIKLWPDEIHMFSSKNHIYKSNKDLEIFACINPENVIKNTGNKEGMCWITYPVENNFTIYVRSDNQMIVLFEGDDLISTGIEYVIDRQHKNVWAIDKELSSIYHYYIHKVLDNIELAF